MRDILITPEGSRITRRDYGSLLSVLIDQPQNDVIRLRLMAAVYVAISRREPRVRLSTVNLTSDFYGSMVVELTGQQDDGSPVAMSVTKGMNSGSN